VIAGLRRNFHILFTGDQGCDGVREERVIVRNEKGVLDTSGSTGASSKSGRLAALVCHDGLGCNPIGISTSHLFMREREEIFGTTPVKQTRPNRIA
jgi:hypothetical protein